MVVLIHHLHLPIMAELPIDLGKFGIALFFMISGYIIPQSFPRGASRWRGGASFAVKRFFRLYPAYWVSIALALASPLYLAEPPPAATIAANLSMLQMGLGQPNLLAVYWTLLFELIFYTLCLALFLLGALERRTTPAVGLALFVAAAAAMAAARHQLEVGLPVVMPLSLACMFLGFTIHRARAAGSVAQLTLILALFALAVTLVCALGYSKALGEPDAIPWQVYAASYAAASVTFAAFVWRDWLRSKLLLLLGATSYAIYLLHLIAIAWVDAFAPELAQSARFALVMALTMAASVALFEWVEAPAIAAGHRLGRKLLSADQARVR